MAQNVGRDALDVFGRDVAAPLQKRPGAGGDHQRDARARRGAVGYQPVQLRQPVVARTPRRHDQIQDVFLDAVVDVNRADGLARPKHLARRYDGRDLRQLAARHAVHNQPLLVADGVIHQRLEHEAVNLRFGQRVRPFLLYWVLRGENQKQALEFVRRVADGYLPFLHRFKQGALDFGGRAVHLVRENEIGEDRPAVDGELRRSRVVDLRPDEVGGQQVGRELQPREVRVYRLRDGLDEQRLGKPGDAFEKNVSIREHPNQDALDELILPDHHLANLIQKPVDKPRLALDLLVELSDAC